MHEQRGAQRPSGAAQPTRRALRTHRLADGAKGGHEREQAIAREFRIEESPVTVPDLSLLIQSGYTPRKEWVERHFRIELEDKKEEGAEGEAVTFDPEKDQDLFGSIFGSQAEGSTPDTNAAAADMQAAVAETQEPPGATPEESQEGVEPEPSIEDELGAAVDEIPEGEEEEGKEPEEEEEDEYMSSLLEELG